MSSPYSRLLAEGTGDETDPPATYNVPPGKVWIVRDVDAYSNAPFADAVLYVKDQTPGYIFCLSKVATGSKDLVQWRGRQVLTEANVGLEVESYSGSWTWRISGYELDA